MADEHPNKNRHSISTSFFASRRLLIEGPGEVDSGAWPISWFRIAKGWGQLPEAYWEDERDLKGAIVPNEPPNADQIAKRNRLPHYQRVRSEAECLYSAIHNRPTSIALGVTAQWAKPRNGLIELDPNLEVKAIHSIPIIDFDFDIGHFVFLNSWGQEWGNRGLGFLPQGYISRYMVDAWTFPAFYAQTTPQQPGVYDVARPADNSKLGMPWIFEFIDGDNDNIVAWAHVIIRSTFCDVEELFVRPDYRRQGYGLRLAMQIRRLADKANLQLRHWIPWGDHEPRNIPGLLAWARKAELRIVRCRFPWAAYLAMTGEPVSELPVLRWQPAKATASVYSLIDPETERRQHVDSGWDDVKADERASLVEKDYQGALTSSEVRRLAELQEMFGRYQDSIAPLPEIEE